MRVTSGFNRLLGLPGITVSNVAFTETTVQLEIKLRAGRLTCPQCKYTTATRYDTRPVLSSWRHLDFGRHQVILRAGLRRLACPTHGVHVEAVPFARPRSGFTRDLEDVAAYLATKTDKATIARFLRLDWAPLDASASPRPPGPGWSRSSRAPARSASSARAFSPRCGSGSTTVVRKA